jgi:hypothetical protein
MFVDPSASDPEMPGELSGIYEVRRLAQAVVDGMRLVA